MKIVDGASIPADTGRTFPVKTILATCHVRHKWIYALSLEETIKTFAAPRTLNPWNTCQVTPDDTTRPKLGRTSSRWCADGYGIDFGSSRERHHARKRRTSQPTSVQAPLSDVNSALGC
jgi:hypothetical protein